MCEILMADIPADRLAFDQERFLLVLPAALPHELRVAIARDAFAMAGQEQLEDGVTCVCGLDTVVPPGRVVKALATRGRTRALAALVAGGVWMTSFCSCMRAARAGNPPGNRKAVRARGRNKSDSIS